MSIHVTAKLLTTGSPFGTDFNRRMADFDRAVKSAATAAARAATAVTQENAKSIRPPVPQRPGRRTTQGNMGRYLHWQVTGGYEVAFDVQKANSRVPYWFIQEVGTGSAATMKYGGSYTQGARPGEVKRGRPSGSNRRNIPSQVGRPIPRSLAFGNRRGGQYSPFGARRGEGLYLRRDLKGAPRFRAGTPSARGQTVTIGREIEPKRFVHEGSKTGYHMYRIAVHRAFKTSFYKPKSL